LVPGADVGLIRHRPGRPPEYPAGVDRICPFLALNSDGRTAIDGYDPDHACHARRPPELLERSRQAELCLAESHRECEVYLAYLAEHAAAAASTPLPAADTHIARTRLIVQPEARRLGAGGQASFGTSPRRWLVAGGIAAVGVAAAATAFAGGFNGLVGAPPLPSPSAASNSETASSSPAAPTPESTATSAPATPDATATPSPSAGPRRTPTATPAAQTYVVQPGDTLSTVANRFGTSVAAIQRANGLGSSDVINVGQVLVIP
jgi:LysM repeat protein